MNKKMMMSLLMVTLMLTFGIATAFAAEPATDKPVVDKPVLDNMLDKPVVDNAMDKPALDKMMDKPGMMSVEKVLKMAPDTGYYRFSLEDLKAKVDTKATDFMIIDVRPADLFNKEHIVGSTSVPLPTFVENLKLVPIEKTIYVVCAVDSNSAYATLVLRMYGYKAFMIPGGETAWKQAGYPVEPTESK